MFGINVRYHCPKCGCDRTRDLGCTQYIHYKGMQLAVIYCYHCNEQLACETDKVDDYEVLSQKFQDKTGLGIVSKLDSFFEKKGYTEDTAEAIIELEMWNYAVETFGDVARQNEYEIKSVIQNLMCRLNQGSLFTITMADLNKESEEAGEYVYTSAGAICW